MNPWTDQSCRNMMCEPASRPFWLCSESRIHCNNCAAALEHYETRGGGERTMPGRGTIGEIAACRDSHSSTGECIGGPLARVTYTRPRIIRISRGEAATPQSRLCPSDPHQVESNKGYSLGSHRRGHEKGLKAGHGEVIRNVTRHFLSAQQNVSGSCWPTNSLPTYARWV